MTASDEGPDDQSTGSVFDFLYYDARRVSSFLAQFDAFGTPQQITSTETASKGMKRGFSLRVGGTLPVPGSIESAEGNVTFGRDPEVGGSEGIARVYDPLWANALALLDYLDEHQLLKRQLSEARIGQFVLLTGQFALRDMKAARALIESPLLQKWLANQIPTDNSNSFSKAFGTKNSVEQLKTIIGMMSLLPHSIQLTFETNYQAVWGTLNPEDITGSASDLALRHGGQLIPGVWNALGVLDAQPEYSSAAGKKSPVAAGPLAPIVDGVSEMARNAVGRPASAYGMTPLMLFREVSG